MKTSIPVPAVLFSDPSPKGSIGAPYMFNEEGTEPFRLQLNNYFLVQIPGRTLYRMWPEMTPAQREKVVKTLAAYTIELRRTRFSAIGSLYLGANDETTVGPMIPSCNPWCSRPAATLGLWAVGDGEGLSLRLH
jgi:hypothetical protein